ncbi:hypothetical protein HDV57DRAFT_504283 [Trichoderma longibrachiatum]
MRWMPSSVSFFLFLSFSLFLLFLEVESHSRFVDFESMDQPNRLYDDFTSLLVQSTCTRPHAFSHIKCPYLFSPCQPPSRSSTPHAACRVSEWPDCVEGASERVRLDLCLLESDPTAYYLLPTSPLLCVRH